MDYRRPEGPVAEAIRATIEPDGYRLVAYSAEVINRRLHVHCVLHHPDGVGLDALAELHRALQPQIETLLGRDEPHPDVRIEFSSPGLTRSFNSFHEFEVFRGRRVSILPIDASEWIHGAVLAADSEQCLIRSDDGTEHTFRPDSVVKARLSE